MEQGGFPPSREVWELAGGLGSGYLAVPAGSLLSSGTVCLQGGCVLVCCPLHGGA